MNTKKVVEEPDQNFVVNRDDLINYVAELAPESNSEKMEEFKMMALNVVLDIILFAKKNSYDRRKKR
jgi:hypothetical protein